MGLDKCVQKEAIAQCKTTSLNNEKAILTFQKETENANRSTQTDLN